MPSCDKGALRAVGLLSRLHPEQSCSLPSRTEVLVSEQDAGDGWVGVISERSKLLQLQQESNLSGDRAWLLSRLQGHYSTD